MADTLITGTTLIEDKRSAISGRVWSCAGQVFRPSTDTVTFLNATGVDLFLENNDAGDRMFHAAVHLPHGAKVTAVIVHGDDATDVWSLRRNPINEGLAASTSVMATSTMGTEDTSITDDIIDNNTYCYSLLVILAQNKEVDGARIRFD